MIESKTWDTRDEVLFIKKLGCVHEETKKHKAKALEGYINACYKRVNWGDIDISIVLREARQQLLKVKA
jgi:hypothetical protein